MVGIGAFPALLQFAMLVFLPETPRWLVKANRTEDAKVVLGKVYGRHSGASEMANGILRAIERRANDAVICLLAKNHGGGLLGCEMPGRNFSRLVGTGGRSRSHACYKASSNYVALWVDLWSGFCSTLC